MPSSLDTLQEAAALAEQIYRRNPADQALDIVSAGGSIPGSDLVLGPAPQGLTNVDNYYYDDSRGFVGRVVQTADTVYVVFRGTDLGATLDPLFFLAPDFADANLPLGSGTTSGTKLTYNSSDHTLSAIPPTAAATQLRGIGVRVDFLRTSFRCDRPPAHKCQFSPATFRGIG
jgi:hypothetical protein